MKHPFSSTVGEWMGRLFTDEEIGIDAVKELARAKRFQTGQSEDQKQMPS